MNCMQGKITSCAKFKKASKELSYFRSFHCLQIYSQFLKRSEHFQASYHQQHWKVLNIFSPAIATFVFHINLQQKWIYFEQFSITKGWNSSLFVLLVRGAVWQFGLLMKHGATLLSKWPKTPFLASFFWFVWLLWLFFFFSYSLTPS